MDFTIEVHFVNVSIFIPIIVVDLLVHHMELSCLNLIEAWECRYYNYPCSSEKRLRYNALRNWLTQCYIVSW